ncbi:MAG: glycerate kinase, partial [Nocardioidaceae bacterium]
MRVLIAPDSFGGTLTAVQAAAAIAAGWQRRAPDDELTLSPMSDGGPGFVDVLHASLGGDLLLVTVSDLYGADTPTAVLMVDRTAYVESAQASGLQLSQRRDPERATSFGVGQMIVAAIEAGASRVMVGLGGSGTNDGGAGLLAALGATSVPPAALERGAEGLHTLTSVDLSGVRERCGDVELVLASDVDNPLTGLRGATNVYGPQKGVTDEGRQRLDA